MANGRNKYQSRENRQRVREVLLGEWDPIGIRGVTEAQDEYDTYATRAYLMLTDEGADAQAIATCLCDIAASHMGLGIRPELAEASRAAAETLARLRPEFRTH